MAPPCRSSRSLALLSFLFASLPSQTHALSFQQAPAAGLDLSQLGRVALAGSFDAISLYDFVGQAESSYSANGSQSLLAQYSNGDFASVLSSDASIDAMCSFTMSNGSLIGVVVGGNFTDLGGQEVQAVALYNPTTQSVTALTGLTGQVSSVYCDNQRETVYVGGTFTGGNSTNAIAWTTGWTNLPFAGFNGPVNSIAQLPNGNVVFGGAFTGLASTPAYRSPDAQIINLVSANITSGPNTTNAAFVNPSNIVCKTSAEIGVNNSWLLADDAPGYWQADFGFGFVPTKLRLYQTQVANRGVKTWRFTALPLDGIMNFTYTDASGVLQSCTSTCPLPEGNTTAQDFHFVNYVGMNSFRIDVSDWYGQGAGLGGIELFEDDIFTYAINAYNEPVCDDVSKIGSNSSTHGNWTQTVLGGGSAQYLSTFILNGTNSTTNTSLPYVNFYPDIKQAGNYSIMVYTPGCQADNTCGTRGRVNITGNLAASGNSILQAEIYQSNDNEKYDTIFNGYVDAVGEGFRPFVTLSPSLGQAKNLTVVAERVQFILTASTGGLNGLYEYNPSQAEASTNFNESAIDMAGAALNEGAQVNELAVVGSDTYVAGQFSTGAYNNIMVVRDGNATALPQGGLNAAVLAMYKNASTLYLGGNFTNTQANQISGLANIASYDTSSNSWGAIGAGVNGKVTAVVPITVELPGNLTTLAIAFSGYFNSINAFGNSPSVAVNNLAVWVPSHDAWLQFVGSDVALGGQINAQANVPGGSPIYAGNVQSQALSANGISQLKSSNGLSLGKLPINITAERSSSSSTITKRAGTVGGAIDGVVVGLFYNQNKLNVTILGGHFAATATNGSTINNLAFINASDSGRVTGLTGNSSSSASILALETHSTTLFAGGTIEGGLVLYDLVNDTSPMTPPALSGYRATVNSIASRPNSPDVYVAGSFAKAGALTCNSICVYDTDMRQWSSISGTSGSISGDSVINFLTWASPSRLLLAGNFTVGNNASNFAAYDPVGQTYHTFPGSDDARNVPGPITAFTAAAQDFDAFFVGGTASNGSAFISHWASGAGNSDTNPQGAWTPVGETLGANSVIDSLQVMSLTSSHSSTPVLAADRTLLVMGQLSLAGYGNVSAALFNGTTFVPFALSTMTDGSPGAIRKAFVENPQNFLVKHDHHLALGLVVLIGLAIAIALIFLLVVAGIVAERIRRRREGYVAAPTRYSPSSWEKGTSVGGIRPEELFRDVGREGAGETGAPRI